MKKLLAALAAMLAGTLLLPTPAQAVPHDNCKIRVRPESNMVRLIYDPFANVQETEEVQLSFTPRMTGCVFGIAIAGQGGSTRRVLTGNGGSITYELQVRGSVVANNVTTPSVAIIPNPGKSPHNNGVQGSGFEQLKVIVPGAQYAAAGSYRDEVTLRMFEYVNGVPQQLGDDQLMSIVVDIPARAQINLAGGYSPVFGGISGTGLDFGELVEGAERDAYIQVRATSSVMLTLTSQNGSKLLHKIEKGAVPAVPYSLTVDQQPLDLATGPKRIDRSPDRGLGAANYRMVARILNVSKRIAGEYGDVITVTVEPK